MTTIDIRRIEEMLTYEMSQPVKIERVDDDATFFLAADGTEFVTYREDDEEKHQLESRRPGYKHWDWLGLI